MSSAASRKLRRQNATRQKSGKTGGTGRATRADEIVIPWAGTDRYRGYRDPESVHSDDG